MAKRRRKHTRRNDWDTVAYYAFTTPRERERDRDRAMTWLPWLVGGVIVFFLMTRSSGSTYVPSTEAYVPAPTV